MSEELKEVLVEETADVMATVIHDENEPVVSTKRLSSEITSIILS